MGKTLKKISCFQRRVKDCSECLGKGRCAYTLVFEPEARGKPEVSGLQYYPRPFYFRANFSKLPQEIPSGDELELELNIFGNSINYLPYFNHALNNLFVGREDYGELKKIYWYAFDEGKWLPFSLPQLDVCEFKLYELTPDFSLLKKRKFRKPRILSLKLLSPLTLRKGGKYLKEEEITVEALSKTLFRRYSNFEYFYGDKSLLQNKDIGHIFSLLEKDTIIEKELSFSFYKRYSNREKRTMKLGGYSGSMKLAIFHPFWLDFWQKFYLIGVGKSTTFGFGNIEIKKEKEV